MSKQKIVIEITESTNPPKVFVDEEEVKVVSLDYRYKTRTNESPGEHVFNLIMPDIVDSRYQTKGLAFGIDINKGYLKK